MTRWRDLETIVKREGATAVPVLLAVRVVVLVEGISAFLPLRQTSSAKDCACLCDGGKWRAFGKVLRCSCGWNRQGVRSKSQLPHKKTEGGPLTGRACPVHAVMQSGRRWLAPARRGAPLVAPSPLAAFPCSPLSYSVGLDLHQHPRKTRARRQGNSGSFWASSAIIGCRFTGVDRRPLYAKWKRSSMW